LFSLHWQLNSYLSKVVVTLDDPGFLFDWDTSVLHDFVQIANENHNEEDDNNEGNEVGVGYAVGLADPENNGEREVVDAGAVGPRNRRRLPFPPIPPWITSNAGAMTAATLTNDIVTFCAAASGGGRAGRVLIAPKNGPQFAKITLRLSNIEADEFIQACAAQLRNGQHLATTYAVSDTKVGRAQPMKLEGWGGRRQIFL
jgi:hypothetical protein